MADVTISYKGANIATMDATGSKTLQTAGTYCEGDIGVEYVKPGGGPVSVPAKEVNFRDYDGTVVYAYTPAEFAALTAMPANPDHSGDEIPLTSQGWNWSFADAQEYVAECGRLNIGQMYIPTDGKTHIKIRLGEGRTKPMVGVGLNGNLTVDWGDGTTSTMSASSTATTIWIGPHQYSKAGEYDITLTVDGDMLITGSSTTDEVSALLRHVSGASSINHAYQTAIKALYIGENVSGIGGCGLRGLYSIERITLPHGMDAIGADGMRGQYALRAIVIPAGATVAQNLLYASHGLSLVSMPKNLSAIASAMFRACEALCDVACPPVTEIGANAFYGCVSLTSLVLPSSVSSIGANALNGCGSLAELHLCPRTPPTLSNTNAFSGVASDFVIYVPRSSSQTVLNAYKTATNWSTYASHMQEEPQ